MIIHMQNVSKVYDNKNIALEQINIGIDKGEFVFIVGQSGAGKTTLIKLLFREELPTTGQIVVGARSIIRLKRWEVARLRRQIGVVFQDYKLLAQKNVYENVAFAMEVTEHTPKEIAKRVPEVLEMVGLANKAQVMPHQLSGGEQQRVAIARAIVNNPMILYADEPTGNLDGETAWGIMKLLNGINQRGTTVLMATHARNIVDAMRKRVLVLEKGRLVRDEVGGGYGETENCSLLS